MYLKKTNIILMIKKILFNYNGEEESKTVFLLCPHAQYILIYFFNIELEYFLRIL